MGTTSITLQGEAKEQLASHKDDGETWTEFALRLVSMLEEGGSSPNTEDVEGEMEGDVDETLETILSELLYLRNEVDDIPSETASEIEGRLRQY